MDISLIICTRDRCQQLVRCLQSVRGITFERPWELIVVDNGSVDETAAVVRQFIGSAGVSAVYVFEPKLGKSNALNTAITIARGQILAFTDDDCYPAQDFLSRVWSAFVDPSVGYITGRIMLHDPTDYPVTINETTLPLTFPARSLVTVGAVQGANMAFRRRILTDIGGFDPVFGPGTQFVSEDLDAAGRASAAGWKGRYCPKVIVSHHHGRKASDIPRLMKLYGMGAGAYHCKLLLNGHEFLWFAKSVYQVRRRSKFSFRMVLWEPVGIVKYGNLCLVRTFRNWLGRDPGWVQGNKGKRVP
jgi:cellulose synthase/poly-beta-1,6-N-acetylglucosamine synthase-like glycosyltransferase